MSEINPVIYAVVASRAQKTTLTGTNTEGANSVGSKSLTCRGSFRNTNPSALFSSLRESQRQWNTIIPAKENDEQWNEATPEGDSESASKSGPKLKFANLDPAPQSWEQMEKSSPWKPWL